IKGGSANTSMSFSAGYSHAEEESQSTGTSATYTTSVRIPSYQIVWGRVAAPATLHTGSVKATVGPVTITLPGFEYLEVTGAASDLNTKPQAQHADLRTLPSGWQVSFYSRPMTEAELAVCRNKEYLKSAGTETAPQYGHHPSQ